MRTNPGPRFWGWTYCILRAAQVGRPEWAAASAATLFTATARHLPTTADKESMLAWGYESFGACLLVWLFRGTVERGLEKISTLIVIWIATFLLLFNLIFVPAGTWWKVFKGLFAFGVIPPGRTGSSWAPLPPILEPEARVASGPQAGCGIKVSAWEASWVPSQRRLRERDPPPQERQHLQPRKREQPAQLEKLVEIPLGEPGPGLGGRVRT